jgi:hypothetical protein
MTTRIRGPSVLRGLTALKKARSGAAQASVNNRLLGAFVTREATLHPEEPGDGARRIRQAAAGGQAVDPDTRFGTCQVVACDRAGCSPPAALDAEVRQLLLRPPSRNRRTWLAPR